jgi:hypothetical protein
LSDIAFSAAAIFSIADFSGIGANSLAPTLLALTTAARDTAICSTGGGVLAQPASRITAARPLISFDLGVKVFFIIFVILVEVGVERGRNQVMATSAMGFDSARKETAMHRNLHGLGALSERFTVRYRT